MINDKNTGITQVVHVTIFLTTQKNIIKQLMLIFRNIGKGLKY